MQLGSYVFARKPGYMTVIQANVVNSHRMTFTSVAYFSWGSDIVGKKIELRWAAMPAAMFESLDTIYQADAAVVWTPTDVVGSTTYNVRLIAFSAEYIPGDLLYRGNTVVTLLILSAVGD